MSTAPLLGPGPGGWIAFGVTILVCIISTEKSKKKNDPHQHDNHNKANPNKKGSNGPQYPYYYHTISSKSKKDAFERSLRDGH